MHCVLVVFILICVPSACSSGLWKQFRYISIEDIRVSNVDASFTEVPSVFHCATHCRNNDKLTSGTCVSFGYNEVSKSCEMNSKPLDFKTAYISMNEAGWRLWESSPCGLAIQRESPKCLYMIWSLVMFKSNWYTADAFCTNMGTRTSLLKVDTAAENVALNSALNVAYDGPDYVGHVYIGANKVNTSWYVWTDETPVTYNNFPALFTPQAAGDGCVFVYITDSEGIWDDRQCTGGGSFVCQRLLN